MSTESFVKSLKIGKVGEKAVSDCLYGHGYECVKNSEKNKLSDYDLMFAFGKKNLTIEVKYDKMAASTGNVCIEYSNSNLNTDSGISCTKADFWSHVIQDGGNNVVFLTSVKKLKKFVADNKPIKTIIKGGDNNASFYLYKSDIILDAIFKRIDIISGDDFNKFIKKLLKETV